MPDDKPKKRQCSAESKPFVFVLMPFKEEFHDIYQRGIKAACNEVGAYCERVDEQIFLGGILERIYSQIKEADIVVADMTGRNANVFYEVGYAHASHRPVIPLTSDADDMPFDMTPYPHIVYGTDDGGIQRLKEDLKTKLSYLLRSPSDRRADGQDLEFFTKNQQPLNGAEIFLEARARHYGISTSSQKILIHNRSKDTIKIAKAVLILPSEIAFELENSDETINLENGKKHSTISLPTSTIHPKEYAPLNLRFALKNSDKGKISSEPTPLALRIYTEAWTKELQFTVNLNTDHIDTTLDIPSAL